MNQNSGNVLILISFLAGLTSLVAGWFKKFSLWSFKVIKQLAIPFTSAFSSIFASLTYFIALKFVSLAVALLDFHMLLLLHFVTGNGIVLFLTCTYLMFYQHKPMFFALNTLCLNLCITLFENHFLNCGI